MKIEDLKYCEAMKADFLAQVEAWCDEFFRLDEPATDPAVDDMADALCRCMQEMKNEVERKISEIFPDPDDDDDDEEEQEEE